MHRYIMILLALVALMTCPRLAASSLQVDLRFDETTGVTAYDSSGNGINGILAGGANFTAGRSGNCVQLNGTSSYVTLGTPSSLNFTGSITMTAWVRPGNFTNTYQGIIEHGPSGSEVFLRLSGNQYQVGSYNGGNHLAAYTAPSTDSNAWVFLAGTYDGAKWNLYRNGSLVASQTDATGALTVSADWRIGATSGNSRYFSGAVDEVRIYNQALSASDIAALFGSSGSIQTSPSQWTMVPNQVQQFTAAYYDQLGNPLYPVLSWSRISGVGLVNEKGIYCSGSFPGNAVLQVVGGGVTNTVNVTVIAPAAGVSGLTARFYASTNLMTPLLTRVDPFVNFDWGAGSPGPSVPADNFTAIWTGQIIPTYSETYTFYLTADDGARFWIGDQLLVSNWQSNSPQASCVVPLKAGQLTRLRLEYFSGSGNARVQLAWKSASQSLQVVPQSALLADEGSYDLGAILEEYWMGVTGNTISDLTNSPAFQGTPTGRDLLTVFEIPHQGWTTNFGVRARGYLVPSVTGNYNLAVSGGNQAQLFLSTDATPVNKTLVAYLNTNVNFESFTQTGTQQSSAKYLLAGRRYYIELLQQQGTNNTGHFSVAWKPSTGGAYALLTGTNLAPYDAAADLSPAQSLIHLAPSKHPASLIPPQRIDYICSLVTNGVWPMSKYYNNISARCLGYIAATNGSGAFTNLMSYSGLSAGGALDENYMLEMGLCYQIYNSPSYPTLYNPWLANRLLARGWAELTNACSLASWQSLGNVATLSGQTGAVGLGLEVFRSGLNSTQQQTVASAIVNLGLQAMLEGYYSANPTVSGLQFDECPNNYNPHCNGDAIMGALSVVSDNPQVAERVLSCAIPSVRAYGLELFKANNGAWHESPNYYRVSMKWLLPALGALNETLGTDFGITATPGFANTMNFAFQDGSPNIGNTVTGANPLYAFGYGDGITSIDPTTLAPGSVNSWLIWVAKRYGNTAMLGQRQGDTGLGWDMLWYDPRSSSLTNLPNAALFRGDTTANHSESIVTMRTGWNTATNAFVGFKGAATQLPGCGHKHLDAGTFVLEALGQRWAMSLGSEVYSVPGRVATNDFNNGRFTYYRNRAEGHNTLVINPTSLVSEADVFAGGSFNPYPDQDPTATSDIILFNTNPTNGATRAVADLTPAYHHLGVSRVWRGLQLNADNSLLVQDEIRAATPAEVYWFMHFMATDIVMTNYAGDPRQLLLTKSNGDSLWLRLSGGPANAAFTVMPAQPLSGTLNQAGFQDPNNTNFLKVAIHLTGQTNAQFAVYLVPIPSGQSPGGVLPTLTALTNWGATAQPVTAPAFVTVPGAPPAILNPSTDATGSNLLISVATFTYQTYVLYAATNLNPPITWTPIATNAGTGGILTNPVPITRAQQYFRYQVR